MMMVALELLRDSRASLRYWLAEQPMVSRFRWDHTNWGSSWPFLLLSILCYLTIIFFLKMLLSLRKRPLPLGPIPAIHNILVVVCSLAVFVGCCEATAVEIKEMSWLWRRRSPSRSPLQLIMCFPVGTRPSGRVFFWSYVFYLTRYHHLFDSVIWVLGKKPLSFLHIFHHVTALCVCFAWLEFSQSLQVFAILSSCLLYAVMYSYFLARRWFFTCEGSPRSGLNFPVGCQIAYLMMTLLANAVLLKMHFFTYEGCNGMGAWVFNAVSNGALLFLFINFYAKRSSTKSKIL